MGAHEGAHAWVAYLRGDDTAYHLGKRTNPLAHVNWNDIILVLMAVGLPIITAMAGWIPMGMAWVPVNPRRLKSPVLTWPCICGWSCGKLCGGLCVSGASRYCRVLVTRTHTSRSCASPLVVCSQRIFCGRTDQHAVWCLQSGPISRLTVLKCFGSFLPEVGQDIMDRIQPYGMRMIIAVFYTAMPL